MAYINKTSFHKRSEKELNNHIVEAVKCFECGKLHDIKSDAYVSIIGNICIGEGGGIIGNNIDEDGRVESTTISCKNCFIEYMKKELLPPEVVIRGL